MQYSPLNFVHYSKTKQTKEYNIFHKTLNITLKSVKSMKNKKLTTSKVRHDHKKCIKPLISIKLETNNWKNRWSFRKKTKHLRQLKSFRNCSNLATIGRILCQVNRSKTF